MLARDSDQRPGALISLDPKTGKQTTLLPSAGDWRLAIDAKDRVAATSSALPGTIFLIDLQAKPKPAVREFATDLKRIGQLAFAKDGNLLALDQIQIYKVYLPDPNPYPRRDGGKD